MGNIKTSKSFNFEQYPEAFNYLSLQHNMTKYLAELIIKDMTSKISKPIDSEEFVTSIIEKYLATHNIIVFDKAGE